MSFVNRIRVLMTASFLIACVVLGWSADRAATNIGDSGLEALETAEHDGARTRVKEHVEAAISILDAATAAEGDRDQQLAAALAEIAKLRWANGSGYLWVQSFDPDLPDTVSMVMHPIAKKLDGKDLTDFRVSSGPRKGKLGSATHFSEGEKMVPADPNASLFVTGSRMCAKQRAGFVAYSWPKPGFEEEQPKISYFMRHDTFGLVVGSGAYIDDIQARVDAQAEVIKGRLGSLKTEITAITVGLFAIVVLMGHTVLASISRRIKRFDTHLEELSHGEADLTARLDTSGKDEFSLLARHFNRFIEGIGGTVSVIRDSAKQVDADTQRMGTGVQSLDGDTDDLRARSEAFETGLADLDEQVQTVASAMEEMSATISEITKSTHSARDSATRGVDTVSESQRLIGELGTSSDEIGAVSKTIRGIAEQTNLLALNATIEAARAGSAGKGFAVVANEVKELAQETAQATGQIEEKVQRLQQDVQSVVNAMAGLDEMIGEISEGQGGVAATLEEQLEAANDIDRATSQVALRSRELSESVQELRATADNVSSVTSDCRQGTDGLAQQAQALNHAVERFKV